MNIKIHKKYIYLGMTKGKKLYVLEILYNDKTNEVESIYECVDNMDNIDPMFDNEGNSVDAPLDKTYYLSDFIDKEDFHLVSDTNIIGFC